LLRRFQARLGDTELVNFYGPTETVGSAAYWTSTSPGRIQDGQTVPIGRPIANMKVYILDPHMQPVPAGVPGELYIGGAGLARGYLRRPDLTAERFVPNPFSPLPEARLYKTGDRARFLPDGNIEYLGRLDYQVKIRGFRIELGEIETTLLDHPAVRDAVVVAREAPSGDKCLVAYVVPRPNAAPAPDDLRRFLRARLPEYMVPPAFVRLSALPLTPSGKVDRARLPAPDLARPAGEHVAPRGPIEAQLVPIWEELLGVHPIGATDNFFDLGGHSLLAGRLLVRVRAACRVNISLRAFFAGPTIADMATMLAEAADA
jgi:acyl-coenzyme A synthetase/AMP-(fatty) acid ligase